MKKILVLILLITISFVSAQDINQFDQKGERHGVWKKNFDGTKVLRYEGEFSHGKEVGTFKFYKNINGRAVLTATRQFNDSDDYALVKFYSSKGKVLSEGKMKGRTYVGEWKYFHLKSDKVMTLEHYNDSGELEGEYKVYYTNGQLAEERHYVNGEIEGTSTWYTENGSVLKKLNYVNNELDGLAQHFDAKGALSIEGQYRNDKKHGIWKYYEDGELKTEKDFTRKSKNPNKAKD